MENKFLIGLTNNFIEGEMQGRHYWKYYCFTCGAYINPKKAENARKAYANFNPVEEIPLLMIDLTILKNGKRGILITNKYIYYKLFPIGKGTFVQGKYELKDIFNLYFQERMTGSHLIINNRPVGMCSMFTRGSNMATQGKLLNELLESYVTAIKEHNRCRGDGVVDNIPR